MAIIQSGNPLFENRRWIRRVKLLCLFVSETLFISDSWIQSLTLNTYWVINKNIQLIKVTWQKQFKYQAFFQIKNILVKVYYLNRYEWNFGKLYPIYYSTHDQGHATVSVPVIWIKTFNMLKKKNFRGEESLTKASLQAYGGEIITLRNRQFAKRIQNK